LAFANDTKITGSLLNQNPCFLEIYLPFSNFILE